MRGFVDSSPTLTYNAARPGIEFTSSSNRAAANVPAYFDLNGRTIPFRYDRAAFTENGSQGVLLLHHHNARGNRAEVVGFQGRYRMYAPMVSTGQPGR